MGRSGYCKTRAEAKCVETAKINLLKEGIVTPPTCNCYDLCKEFEYSPTIHLLEYPLPATEEEFAALGPCSELLKEGFFFPCLKGLKRKSGDELQVEIYYETLKYHRVIEYPVYTTSSLTSAIGT